jgi:hypothetical protein
MDLPVTLRNVLRIGRTAKGRTGGLNGSAVQVLVAIANRA